MPNVWPIPANISKAITTVENEENNTQIIRSLQDNLINKEDGTALDGCDLTTGKIDISNQFKDDSYRDCSNPINPACSRRILTVKSD